jgi:hypothetical protein
MRNINKGILSANIFSSSATPVVLENIHHFTIDSLIGSNPGTATAVTFAKSGQYIVAGATISALTSDFSNEGFNDSWANLSAYGTYMARGTNLYWGSGYTYLQGTGLRIGAKSPSPGNELVVDGDVVWSGAEKSYGIRYALDNGTTTSALLYITASLAGLQANASPTGYRYNYVSSPNPTGSVLIRQATTDGADYTAFNVGENSFLLYPPVGGKINKQAVNSSITVPTGTLALMISSGSGIDFNVSIIPTKPVSIDLDGRYVLTSSYVAGATTSLNGYSGSISILAGPNITVNSGSGFIMITGSAPTDISALNAFSASHNIFSQSVNGFTASFTASVQAIGDIRYAGLTTFNAFSASVNGFTASFTASVQSIGDARYATLTNYNQLSSSHNLFSASVNGFTASFSSSVQSIASTTYGPFTSSINTLTQSLNTFSASHNTFSASVNGFTASFSSSVQSIASTTYGPFTASHNVFSQSVNGFTASFTASVQSIGDARYVQTLNAIRGALTLTAGPNITINTAGTDISITGSAGGSGVTTSINGYSGSLSILAGPNVTVNSGSGFIMITGSAGSAPTDISALNTFSASHNIFSQSVNGFTASFSSSVQTIGDSRYILTSSYNIFTGSKRTVTAVFDGGGSVLTVGSKAYIPEVPYNATITGWRIISPVAGSVVVDVWKDIYANFPATVIDTIAGSEKPTLSTATKNEDKALTTWTTAITSGDHLVFNIDSATTVTYVVVQLFLTVP